MINLPVLCLFMNKQTVSQYMKYFNESSASLILKLLLCRDFIFITLHIINRRTPFLNNDNFSINFDRGYPEIYQYIKFLSIIILLVYVSKVTRSFGYVVWILLFTYFLCDDALQIHETVGGYIAKNLNFTPPLNLRPQDIGEMGVSVTVGLFFLPFFA